jgi:hypothetical protein
MVKEIFSAAELMALNITPQHQRSNQPNHVLFHNPHILCFKLVGTYYLFACKNKQKAESSKFIGENIRMILRLLLSLRHDNRND